MELPSPRRWPEEQQPGRKPSGSAELVTGALGSAPHRLHHIGLHDNTQRAHFCKTRCPHFLSERRGSRKSVALFPAGHRSRKDLFLLSGQGSSRRWPEDPPCSLHQGHLPCSHSLCSVTRAVQAENCAIAKAHAHAICGAQETPVRLEPPLGFVRGPRGRG